MFKAHKVEDKERQLAVLDGVMSIRGIGKVVPCETNKKWMLHWDMREGSKQAQEQQQEEANVMDRFGQYDKTKPQHYMRHRFERVIIAPVIKAMKGRVNQPALFNHPCLAPALQPILLKHSSHRNIELASAIKRTSSSILEWMHELGYNTTMGTLRDGFRFGIHPVLKKVWNAHEEMVAREKKKNINFFAGIKANHFRACIDIPKDMVYGEVYLLPDWRYHVN